MNVAESHSSTKHSLRRWLLIGFCLLGVCLYISSYVRLRQQRELIHARSHSGEDTFHFIRPGDSGPHLFMAASFAGQLDQLDAIAAAQQRRERLYMGFFAPACYTEVLVWELID